MLVNQLSSTILRLLWLITQHLFELEAFKIRWIKGAQLAVFTHKLLNNEQPTINGNGKHTRDYVFVIDVVEANIKALSYKKNDFFNISTAKRISNNEVFETIAQAVGSKIKPLRGPNRPGDALHNSLSNKKAATLLKWKPKVSFKEGVKLTIKYYQSG